MTFASLFLGSNQRLRPAWRALVFLPVYLLLLIGFLLVSSFFVVFLSLPHTFEMTLCLWGLASALASLLAAALLLSLVDHHDFRALGLWFYPGWSRHLGLGLAGGFLLLTLVVTLQWLLDGLEFRELATSARLLLASAVWYVLVLLPAAAGEELVFRGYPFQRLVEACGAWPAVLLSSAIFGALHLNNPAPTALSTLNTALMGALLSLAYLKSRGLWFPIGLHFAWNYALGFFYSLPVSGLRLQEVLWRVKVSGAQWVTGGAYGPEGSLLATLIAVAGVAALVAVRPRQVPSAPPPAVELG